MYRLSVLAYKSWRGGVSRLGLKSTELIKNQEWIINQPLKTYLCSILMQLLADLQDNRIKYLENTW